MAKRKPRRRGPRLKVQPKQSVTLAAPQSKWDEGADGHASQLRRVREPASDEAGKNPNAVYRSRRVGLAHEYQARGLLTPEAVAAAEHLRNAVEATQTGKPAIRAVQVDTSGVSDGGASAAVDLVAQVRRLKAAVPRCAAGVVNQVVIEDRPIEAPDVGYMECAEQFAALAHGLEKLAEAINGG